MVERPLSIPRPLVRTNQWTIFLSAVLTIVTGQYWLLLIPLIANILGLFGFNPIMRLAKSFLKKDTKSYIPEDVGQQKFNSIIAIFCLAMGLIGFVVEWQVLGYMFTAMVGVASGIAILGFCVGCFIHFQWNQAKYRRQQKQILKEN